MPENKLVKRLFPDNSPAGGETFLSGWTERFAPATRPIAPSEWEKSIARGNAFVLFEKKRIRAALRLIERSNGILEIGSVVSRIQHGAQDLFFEVLKTFPERDFALVTRRENERMCRLVQQIGFEEVTAESPGLREILEKDGKVSSENRVLFLRPAESIDFSFLQYEENCESKNTDKSIPLELQS